jgi:hypothetical protein
LGDGVSESEKEGLLPDIVLSDGREIAFDLSRVTMREYNGLFSADQPPDKDAEIIARVAGLSLEEYRAMQTSDTLTLMDWKRFHQAFFKKCREPLADPK